MALEIRIERKTGPLPRPCACGNLVAAIEYEWRGGYLYRDTWTCWSCGVVIFAWVWSSTMAAAQECRALDEGKSGKPVRSGCLVSPRSTGQLGLF